MLKILKKQKTFIDSLKVGEYTTKHIQQVGNTKLNSSLSREAEGLAQRCPAT